MKNSRTRMLGVTLLEIMLVLAIAAIIVLMSIRFYRGASAAQQANSMFNMMGAVVGAYENLSVTTGSYASVNSANVKSYLSMTALTSPWGTAITVSTPAANQISFSVPSASAQVCVLMTAKLSAITNYSSVSCPAGGGTLTATYTR